MSNVLWLVVRTRWWDERSMLKPTPAYIIAWHSSIQTLNSKDNIMLLYSTVECMVCYDIIKSITIWIDAVEVCSNSTEMTTSVSGGLVSWWWVAQTFLASWYREKKPQARPITTLETHTRTWKTNSCSLCVHDDQNKHFNTPLPSTDKAINVRCWFFRHVYKSARRKILNVYTLRIKSEKCYLSRRKTNETQFSRG